MRRAAMGVGWLLIAFLLHGSVDGHGGLSLNMNAAKNKGARSDQDVTVRGKPGNRLQYIAGRPQQAYKLNQTGLLHADVTNCGMQKCIAQHHVQKRWL